LDATRRLGAEETTTRRTRCRCCGSLPVAPVRTGGRRGGVTGGCRRDGVLHSVPLGDGSGRVRGDVDHVLAARRRWWWRPAACGRRSTDHRHRQPGGGVDYVTLVAETIRQLCGRW